MHLGYDPHAGCRFSHVRSGRLALTRTGPLMRPPFPGITHMRLKRFPRNFTQRYCVQSWGVGRGIYPYSVTLPAMKYQTPLANHKFSLLLSLQRELTGVSFLLSNPLVGQNGFFNPSNKTIIPVTALTIVTHVANYSEYIPRWLSDAGS